MTSHGRVVNNRNSSVVYENNEMVVVIHFRIIVITAVGVFGIVTNIMNIAVFLKQNMKDCVNIFLISLAFSDFASVTLGLMTLFCSASIGIVPYSHFKLVYDVLYRTCGIFYGVSTFTTTVISLERCLSVSFPFKAKSFLTASKTVFVVFFIYFGGIISSIPYYLFIISPKSYFIDQNITLIVSMWFSPATVRMAEVAITAVQCTSEPVCLIINLISTYVMIYCLKRSTVFKSKNNKLSLKTLNEDVSRPLCCRTSKQNMNAYSNSYMKVSKTVAVLALASSACVFLRFIIVIVILSTPGISTGKEYADVFYLLLDGIFFFQTMNASVPVFVLNAFNIAFRRTFQEMFFRVCTYNTNE